MSIPQTHTTHSTLRPEAEGFSETVPAKEETIISSTPEDDEELDFSEIRCCFCGRELLERSHAHNPWPVTEENYGADGSTYCCRSCNDGIVWRARTMDGERHAEFIAKLRKGFGLV